MGTTNNSKLATETRAPADATKEVNSGTPPIAPTFPNPSENDKDAWRRAAKQDVAALLIDGDTALMRVIAMALIDYQMNGARESEDYFDDRLKSLDLVTAGVKPTMRAATVATGLNRADKVTGEKAAKLLDSIATAMEGLALKVGHEGGLEYEYSAQCVERLIEIIKSNKGGTRALADVARQAKAQEKNSELIQLKRTSVAEIIRTLVKQRYASLSGSKLQVAARNGEGQLVPVEGIELTLDQIAPLVSDTDLSEGRVTRLHEMQLATRAIAREETAKPKVRGANPANGPKRFTEPHINLAPDGTVTISAHMAQASNVVVIKGLNDLVDELPSFSVMLPPQAHNELGRNLDTPDRRNALVVSEEPPAPGTSTTWRSIMLRSAAAVDTNYLLNGSGKRVSWRFPSYGSESDDHVPAVRERKWERICVFDMTGKAGSFENIVASAGSFDYTANRKRSAALDTASGTFTVTAEKGLPISATATGPIKSIACTVTSADFRGLLRLLREHRVEQLTLDIDERSAALRWQFSSKAASYDLYMPLATPDGQRITSAFEPLAIVPQAAVKKAA